MIYKLNDLNEFIPNRKTYAVLGNPVGHSISPELHKEIFNLKELDYDYIKIELEEYELNIALELIRQKLSGFNCTIPFKSLILPYLNFSDERVKLLNACNTVNIKQGELYGFNTDGYGFKKALELSGIDLSDKKVLILGAGGAATSIAYEAAINNSEITCAARRFQKALSFTQRISEISGNNRITPADLSSVSGNFNIIINATPVGMHPSPDKSPVNMNNFTGVDFVYDCIYNPPMTKLLKDAQDFGIKYDNGISMLVLQGLLSERYWNVLDFSKAEINNVITKTENKFSILRLKKIRKRSNIALIGFMGCGKTTIGKQLACRLGMNFIDLDKKIEAEQKASISEIFEKYGENHFRELETKAIYECKSYTNTVISTGGGAVLKPMNSEILKESSFVIFIDLAFQKILDNLRGSINRPLLTDNSELYSLFEKRYSIYKNSCDISVVFDKNLSDSTKLIMPFI